MTARRFDVLIVGAGPSGSALAHHLAGRGFAVALTDKKAFPRDKPCGEFLSPQCRPYLVELGVDDLLLQKGTRLVAGMQLHGHGRIARGGFRALPGLAHAQHGYAVRREILDETLREIACARPEVTWLPRHEVTSLVNGAGGRVLGARFRTPDRATVELHADFVVGADGVRSRVAAAMGVQRQRHWLDRIALIGRFDGVPAAAMAEVHFVPDAYFAATTVDDGTFHLNLVCDRARLRAHAGAIDEFVAAQIAAAPALATRLAASRRLAPWRGTGPLSFTTTSQTGPGIALVGDACGYVDPLTGEGIYFALHGARALAEALATARHEPHRAAGALADYARRRRREVAPRQWLSLLLQRGLRQPWITSRVLALLAAHRSLCDLVVTMTGDCIHPRDLLRPSFWRRWRGAEVAQ